MIVDLDPVHHGLDVAFLNGIGSAVVFARLICPKRRIASALKRLGFGCSLILTSASLVDVFTVLARLIGTCSIASSPTTSLLPPVSDSTRFVSIPMSARYGDNITAPSKNLLPARPRVSTGS